MKKWIKVIVIAILILSVMGIGGISLLKIYRNERNTTSSKEMKIIPGIICIGDSLTNGAGGDGMGYPDYLARDLDTDGYIIPVYNLGVGGENTVTIASRIGALPMTVGPCTIPSETEPVEIEICDAYNGWPVTPLRQGSQNNNGVNPCRIGGVEGTISIVQDDYGSEDYQYYFTRTESGEEIVIERGTLIETYASSCQDYQDGIFIVFIGANHGYEDIEDLIAQQQAILSLQEGNADKYVIIGISTGTYEERAELERSMLEMYGDRYINVRELLSNEEKLEAAGLTITDTDREQMMLGMIPDCARADDTHFNTIGYEILEIEIYERMKSLGYLDNVSSIAQDFNSKWGIFHKLEITLRKED